MTIGRDLDSSVTLIESRIYCTMQADPFLDHTNSEWRHKQMNHVAQGAVALLDHNKGDSSLVVKTMLSRKICPSRPGGEGSVERTSSGRPPGFERSWNVTFLLPGWMSTSASVQSSNTDAYVRREMSSLQRE